MGTNGNADAAKDLEDDDFDAAAYRKTLLSQHWENQASIDDDIDAGMDIEIGGAPLIHLRGADEFPCLDIEDAVTHRLQTHVLANLIEAIPAMYEALQMVLRDVGDGGPSSDYVSGYTSSKCREALTKAQGIV